MIIIINCNIQTTIIKNSTTEKNEKTRRVAIRFFLKTNTLAESGHLVPEIVDSLVGGQEEERHLSVELVIRYHSFFEESNHPEGYVFTHLANGLRDKSNGVVFSAISGYRILGGERDLRPLLRKLRELNRPVSAADYGMIENIIDVISKIGGITLLITGILILTNQLQVIGFYIIKIFPFMQNFG